MKKPIKFCKNPDCEDEILDYKSSKKLYCSDKCRNYHGHKRRSEENLEFNLSRKGMLENYKVLKLHKDAGIMKETLEKYEKFGFKPAYLPVKKLYEHEGNKIEYYQIKDIQFGLNPENTNQIIIYK